MRPVIARVPNYVAGGYRTIQFRLEGDTLWLTAKTTELHDRYGDEVVPVPVAL